MSETDTNALPKLISDWFALSDQKRRREKPSIVQQLRSWYESTAPVDGPDNFGIVVNSNVMARICATVYRKKAKKHRPSLQLIPIKSIVPHIRGQMTFDSESPSTPTRYNYLLGTFRIVIPNLTPLYIIAYTIGTHNFEYLIGSQSSIDALNRIMYPKNRNTTAILPKKGIHVLHYDILQKKLTFTKQPIDIENTERFRLHPMHDVVKTDIDQFYQNLDFWTRNRQAGMRKILLAGPPGTGKTSIIAAIAAQYASTHVVLHARDTSTLIQGCEAVAAANRPAIVVCEELDLLKTPDGPGLLWLDGTTCTRNPSGTMVITTTNYPSSLDPRVRKRPGRLDKIINVIDLMPGEAAVIAATFLDDKPSAEEFIVLGESLDKTTPAEIREIINIANRKLSPGAKLTGDDIVAARRTLSQSMAAADEANYDTEDERHETFLKNGPRFDPSTYVPDHAA